MGKATTDTPVINRRQRQRAPANTLALHLQGNRNCRTADRRGCMRRHKAPGYRKARQKGLGKCEYRAWALSLHCFKSGSISSFPLNHSLGGGSRTVSSNLPKEKKKDAQSTLANPLHARPFFLSSFLSFFFPVRNLSFFSPKRAKILPHRERERQEKSKQASPKPGNRTHAHSGAEPHHTNLPHQQRGVGGLWVLNPPPPLQTEYAFRLQGQKKQNFQGYIYIYI